MVHLTLSYIPWIFYWLISANKKRHGIAIAFFIGVILLLIEKRAHMYSTMDIFSIFYWLIASIITYIYKKDIFIEGDGYIGYGMLSLMAIISVILRKPFMRYYVSKDFRNSSSGMIDQLSYYTSMVWICVFLISTVIFWKVKKPTAAVISSNIFVVIGIILSIYITSKN